MSPEDDNFFLAAWLTHWPRFLLAWLSPPPFYSRSNRSTASLLIKTFKAFRARVFEAAKESSNLTEKSPWPVSFRYGLAEVARGMIAQTNVPAKMSSKLF